MIAGLLSIMSEFKPSQLDEFLSIPCPFFVASETAYSSAYRAIHDVVLSRVVSGLKSRFPELSFRIERTLTDFPARVDCEITDGDKSLILEVKTGSVKIVQPCVYTFLTGFRTIIADVKSGSVISIEYDFAKRVVEEVIKHAGERKELMNREVRIEGEFCSRCVEKCGVKRISRCRGVKLNPYLFSNIQPITEALSREIEGFFKKA